MSNEFDITGRHKSEDVICHNISKIRSSVISVIADGVINRAGTNVALSKDDFAEYVLIRKPGFDGFDFTEFRKIFDVISAIVGSQS